jgi:hypothetical protein
MMVAETPVYNCVQFRVYAHPTDQFVLHWIPVRPFILPDIIIYISTQFIVRYERDYNNYYCILFFRQELLQQLEEEK